MTDIERVARHADLQALLDEYGIAAPENTVARSSECGIDLAVTRLYGVELALPTGAIGKFVVRQVQQMPDNIASLSSDHSHVQKGFRERQMRGLFADMRVHSVSSSHLLVARKSILVMQNSSATNRMAMQTSKSFVAGRKIDTGSLLEFDATGAAVTRPLELSEMDYSEPGSVAMILAALKRR